MIYGRQNPALNLEIAVKDLENLVLHSASENILVDLSIEGSSAAKRLALVQEIQHHPLTGQLVHLDLHEVNENEKVTVTIPVETVGEPIGVKVSGGVLEHVLFRLKVRAFPKDLPEVLEVDVSALDMGQSIHIGDIKAPPGVEILGLKKVVVISVAAPLTEAQEAAAEAAVTGPGEPEMIKEKKEDGTAPAAEKTAEKPAADKGEKGEKAEKAEKKPAEKKK